MTQKEGQPIQPEPGIRVLNAPRRAVRSRSEDVFILSLTIDGNENFNLNTKGSWLDDLAHSFFRISGSVTTALRELIESVNLAMLEENLQMAQENKAVKGAINLMAIHRQAVYIAQSGFTHAFVLGHETFNHFYDVNQSDRGLGFSRNPAIRYFQADIGKGAYVFVTDTPPRSWTKEGLFTGAYPNREHLRRRLLNQIPQDFSLTLLEVKPGEGSIKTITSPALPDSVQIPDGHELAAKKDAEEAMNQVDSELPVEGNADSLEDTQEIFLREKRSVPPTFIDEESVKDDVRLENDKPEIKDENLGELQDLAIERSTGSNESKKGDWHGDVRIKAETVKNPEDMAETGKVNVPEEDRHIQVTQDEDAGLELSANQHTTELNKPSEEKDLLKPQKKNLRDRTRRQSKRNLKADLKNFRMGFKHWQRKVGDNSLNGLSGFFKWWHAAVGRTSAFFNKILTRSSVGQNGIPDLSRGTMLFIAVMVPLAMVVIAVGFYLARGRNQQYDFYYEQAQVASANALVASDPRDQQNYWALTLDYLDQAEFVRETDEIDQLRNQALNALDGLEGAIRMAYQPAIMDVLNEDILITRIVSYGSDLYLLDSNAGQVIHAVMGDQGYEIDLDFSCEPGSYLGGAVSAFVDMVSMPINNPYQAQILAVDANGGIAFCGKGQGPLVQALPSQGLNTIEIQRVAYDVNYMYVLDPLANNILVYRPDNYQFIEPPTLYFEGDDLAEMPDLSQIVDLAVNGSDLYLLRTDGMIVNCRTSGVSENPVTCENPVTYEDGREGREEQSVVMPESSFNTILYTSPPDPALSFLDATNADIYRFSVRFRLYKLLRPDLGDFELASMNATAFTIGSNRFAYIAFGNQVFYAYIE